MSDSGISVGWIARGVFLSFYLVIFVMFLFFFVFYFYVTRLELDTWIYFALYLISLLLRRYCIVTVNINDPTITL